MSGLVTLTHGTARTLGVFVLVRLRVVLLRAVWESFLVRGFSRRWRGVLNIGFLCMWIFKSVGKKIAASLKEFCNRWCKREHVGCDALGDWRLSIFCSQKAGV